VAYFLGKRVVFILNHSPFYIDVYCLLLSQSASFTDI